MDWDKYSFVVCGKNRKKVLLSLETPLVPTEIANLIGESLSHVSHTLKALTEKELVVCLNPDRKVGRVFQRTDHGNKVIEFIKVKEYIISKSPDKVKN